MKKVFNKNGEFYGSATKVVIDKNNLIITMPGDFSGMAEKNLIFTNASIIYEDDNRLYIDFN